MGLSSGELWLADTAAFLEAYWTHGEGSPSLGTALLWWRNRKSAGWGVDKSASGKAPLSSLLHHPLRASFATYAHLIFFTQHLTLHTFTYNSINQGFTSAQPPCQRCLVFLSLIFIARVTAGLLGNFLKGRSQMAAAFNRSTGQTQPAACHKAFRYAYYL